MYRPLQEYWVIQHVVADIKLIIIIHKTVSVLSNLDFSTPTWAVIIGDFFVRVCYIVLAQYSRLLDLDLVSRSIIYGGAVLKGQAPWRPQDVLCHSISIIGLNIRRMLMHVLWLVCHSGRAMDFRFVDKAGPIVFSLRASLLDKIVSHLLPEQLILR